MWKNYFQIAIRNLFKNRTFSLLNIFGLATGITCASLIFLWVEDELTFNQVHEKKENLYALRINANFGGDLYTLRSTPRPMAAAIKKEIPGIANTARISDTEQRKLFSFSNKSLYAVGRYADPALLDMFSFSFVQGNAKNAFTQLYSLVITEKAALKFFGTAKAVLGRTLRVNNEQDYVITGVVKDFPLNSSLQFEWLAPYEVTIQERIASGEGGDEVDWGSYGPFTYVELEANANLLTVNKQLKDFITHKKADQKNVAFLFPMSDWRLNNSFENGQQVDSARMKQLRMLSTIAWIILLIACINFMNLATANSQKRSKEVGMRKVLGAGKGKLIQQFMGEALFLSGLAALMAVVLIVLALPAFNQLMEKELSLDLVNPVHILGLLAIALICGLVAGSYPALYLSSFRPALVLKKLNLKTGSAAMIRRGLVVMQFSASVVFIISTIVVFMQIQHVKNRELGFNKENLIEIDTQQDVSSILPVIKQDLLQTGVVENVASSDRVMIQGGNTDDRFTWQAKAKDNKVAIAFRNVSPEFIATSGMQLIEGKDFAPNSAAENSKVIITQSMAKLMGEESAVGKIIQSPRDNEEGVFSNMTVVGVISDYVYGDVYGENPGPVLFFCKTTDRAKLLYIRLKAASNLNEALGKIEAVMKKDNPAFPFEYKFVDDQFNELFQSEAQISKISSLFAVLAVFISCLGLFGLAAYTAERRTKEISVRKVLGASVGSITGLLSKEFLQLVFISCLIAFPIAWYLMHNWLQTYAYRIEVRGWVFFAAGVMVMLIAVLTVSFQALRAALANPVKSLRSE